MHFFRDVMGQRTAVVMKNTAMFSLQLVVNPDGPIFSILKGHVDSVCEAAIYLEQSIKVCSRQQLKIIIAEDKGLLCFPPCISCFINALSKYAFCKQT